MNINITEDNLGLVHKLLQELGELSEAHPTTPGVKVLPSTKKGPLTMEQQGDDYFLINKSGVEVIVEDLYQIGCLYSGTLKVEIRDGWNFPNRLRWVNRPWIRLTLLPWGNPIIISEAQKGRNEGGFVFEIPYPGTTNPEEFPALTVEVRTEDGIYIRCEIDLLPHIVVPGQSTDEWFKLHRNDDSTRAQKMGGECLIRLTFETNDQASRTMEEYIRMDPLVLAEGGGTPLSFEGIPSNRWYTEINAKQRETTVRRVALDFGKALGLPQAFTMVMPVDESGSFMLRAKLPDSDEFHSHLNVCVTSAMRDRKRKLLLLHSPITIQNNSDNSLEVLVCELGTPVHGNAHPKYSSLYYIRFGSEVHVRSSNEASNTGMGVDMLFDRRSTTKWVEEASREVTWIEFEFETSVMVGLYTFAPPIEEVDPPCSWKFMGSNGKNWDVLDVREGVEWTSHKPKEFWCNEVGFYYKYRIEFGAHSRAIGLSGAEFYEDKDEVWF